MMINKDNTILEAVGEVLRDERIRIDERLDNMTGDGIAKSVAMQKHTELEQTIIQYLDNFINSRSQVVSGQPCEFVKRSLR